MLKIDLYFLFCPLIIFVHFSIELSTGLLICRRPLHISKISFSSRKLCSQFAISLYPSFVMCFSVRKFLLIGLSNLSIFPLDIRISLSHLNIVTNYWYFSWGRIIFLSQLTENYYLCNGAFLSWDMLGFLFVKVFFCVFQCCGPVVLTKVHTCLCVNFSQTPPASCHLHSSWPCLNSIICTLQ